MTLFFSLFGDVSKIMWVFVVLKYMTVTRIIIKPLDLNRWTQDYLCTKTIAQNKVAHTR